jgi:hypothetical protein
MEGRLGTQGLVRCATLLQLNNAVQTAEQATQHSSVPTLTNRHPTTITIGWGALEDSDSGSVLAGSGAADHCCLTGQEQGPGGRTAVRLFRSVDTVCAAGR